MSCVLGRSLVSFLRIDDSSHGTLLGRMVDAARGWIHPPEAAEQHLLKVLASCVPAIPIWVVSDEPQVRAHIVCCHRTLEEFRGYLFFFDAQERVVMFDTVNFQYVRYFEGSARVLVVIDGIANAKLFVDRLVGGLLA